MKKSEEGYAVRAPALPGCWSQGATEEDATANIKDAIATYLASLAGLEKSNRGSIWLNRYD